MFFFVVYLHMNRALIYGSYRKPRELVWIFGVGIFLCLMAEAFFGYLLPWGQMSFWGAQVIVNLFSAIPFIGPELSIWIRGDYVVSDATLNRFFAFHVIAIPLVLLGLVAAHVIALHEVGSNNPDGVAYGTIDLLAQSYQSQGVPVAWQTSATATPITDIENFITINRDTRGRTFGKILMSMRLWNYFKKTTEVKNFIATFYNTGKTTSAYAVTIDSVNEMFMANRWPMIEIVEHNTHIEVDGAPTYVRGFDDNNVAFVPDGKIGTLFNAVSMEEMHQVANKTYAKFGPTLVSKWAESDPLVEFTGMEMNAFPSINIDAVYVLKTQTVQASFV